MKKIIIIAGLLTTVVSYANCGMDHSKHDGQSHASSAKADEKVFGKAIASGEKPLGLKEAVAKISSVKDKEIVVTGKVVDVCKSEGCWMKLKEGDLLVHITVAEHSFFIPKYARDKKALVQGKLQEREMSVAEAKHYAKDAGKSKKEIDAIKAPQKSYEFVATGVELM